MNEMILNTAPEAASFVENISGWVSRNGVFHGKDERIARWYGCTHVECRYCGHPTPKLYTACHDCREKRAAARYKRMEKAVWDQNGMLYSDSHDKFFCSWDEVADFADEHELLMSDLRLVICEPEYLCGIDTDYWSDNMPDEWDGGLPTDVVSALNALNAAISVAGPVSWQPGKKAVIIASRMY